jgi:hypothetical protein
MSYANDEDLNDIPPYPLEWTAEQRVAAYWHALNFTHFPGVTEGWFAVWKSLEREQKRRGAVKTQEEKPQ